MSIICSCLYPLSDANAQLLWRGSASTVLCHPLARKPWFGVISIIAEALGMLLPSWAAGLGAATAAMGVIAGFAQGCMFKYTLAVLASLAANIPAKEAGRCTGIALAGVGVGFMAWAIPVQHPTSGQRRAAAFTEQLGWRTTARVTAGVVLATKH